MSSKCLVKLPHSCGSGDALQVFEREDGTVDGYCYACSTYVRHPFGERVAVEDVERPKLGKTKEEIEQEIAEIEECSAHDLPERGLRKTALEHYGIKVGLSYQDGKTPALVYFPYRSEGKIVAYKVRLLEQKRSWWVGEAGKVDLFGWQEAIESGAKRLVIVEGEFDVPATMTILKRETKKEWQDNIPAIVSIPHGAGTAHTVLQKKLKDIRKYFKDVSIMFDQDAAGQRATEECCKVMPEAKVINLPKKDANECLLEGATKAAHSAITFNAKRQKNSRIVWGDDVHQSAREPPVWGYSWPWDHLNKATRGIRLGETIYIGAGVS